MAGIEMAPFPNWGMLGQIGQNIGEGWRRRQLINDMQSAINQDGTYNYDKMIGVLAQHNPMAAAKFASDKASLDALTDYRSVQGANAAQNARDLDLEIWDAYQRGDFNKPEPMRLSPGEVSSSPSGTPGVSLAQASGLPAAVADKVLSIDQKKYLEKSGTNKAEAEAKAALKEDSARNIEATLRDLYNNMQGFDDASVENALGPWQGDQNSMWGYNPRTIAAQNVGAVLNAIPGLGGKESTYEVRAEVASATTALANALKPFAKAGGAEGQWTNYDQQKLESIVGELAQSKDKAEFDRRFHRAITRINSAWDLNIDPKVAASSIITGPKVADRYSNPPEAATPVPTFNVDPVTGNMSPTVPSPDGADQAEAAEAGTLNIPGATRDPRGPYTGPAPEGTIISNGQKRLIKRGGKWVPVQ